MTSRFINNAPEIERAVVVDPETGGHGRSEDTPARKYDESRLDEATGLALALDLVIAGSVSVRIRKPNPATLFGTGKVSEIKTLCEEAEAGLCIVNGALTPVQQRNLEKDLGVKVIDRTGLILEIFGRRARTREGKLQVELARLEYERSRLVRTWTHLERQRATGTTGGPGETQIELDRRMIADRIKALKGELDEVRRTRSLHRQQRKKVPYPRDDAVQGQPPQDRSGRNPDNQRDDPVGIGKAFADAKAGEDRDEAEHGQGIGRGEDKAADEGSHGAAGGRIDLALARYLTGGGAGRQDQQEYAADKAERRPVFEQHSLDRRNAKSRDR